MFIFVVLTIGVTVLSIYRIKHAQGSLETFRDRLDDVIDNFGKFKNLFGESTRKKKWPSEVVVVWTATFFFCYLIIISGGA